MHLVSDGGDDFSAFADEFRCRYVYEKINNATYRCRHAATNQYVWLRRVYDACLTTFSDIDWIVLLESDVETLRSPVLIPQFALGGPGLGPAWTEPLKDLFRNKFQNLSAKQGLGHSYTGCGGSVLNKLAFMECFRKTEFPTFIHAKTLDRRILETEDATLSFLFQINGYDTGRWGEVTGWCDRNQSSYAFVHGNKQYYNKPLP